MDEDKLITLSFKFDNERLFKAFFAQDDVSAITRCHFEAERASKHVLAALTKGRFKPGGRVGQYLSQQLEILRLLGFDPKGLRPLEIHNAHRNKFAHEGREVIDKAQLEKIHQSILDIVPNFGEMEFIFPDVGFKARYENLTDRQKYVANTMMAVAALAAVSDVNEGRAKNTRSAS